MSRIQTSPFSPVTRGGVYYEQAARACKQSVSIPVMLVGGIRSLAVSQRLVQDGIADYLSLCRPLIREPDLIRRWKSGDARDSECLSDDSCFQPGFDGKGVYCVHTKGHREKAGLLRFYSGSTGAVNTRRAVDECLENALGDEDTDCDLLIFYTTMGHAFREILSQARSRCPHARIVGTSCAGIIGREGPNESMRALAVMAVRGPKEAIAVAGIESIVNADPFEVGERIARELRRQNPNPTLILLYPSMLDILPAERAIQGMESVLGPQVPICGALSIDNMKFSSAFEFLDDHVFERGAVAIGLTDPTLEVISQANHGFPVIGEPFSVTRSTANRVYELDGKPAWTCLTARLGLSEYSHPATVVTIGELAEELPQELWEEYGSRFIIRAGGAMNDADGSLYTATSIAEGTRLWLVRRDEKEMIEGIKRLVERVVRRCQGRRPVAVFHADCALRGKLLVNRVLKEEVVSHIQDPLCRGENVPWMGLYGGGEMTMLGGRNRTHVFTTSLHVLVER